MHTMSRTVFLGAAMLAPLAAVPANAQQLALYGTVLVAGGSAPTPLRFARVVLNANGTTVGPILTDDGGHFAFLGTSPGTYTLRVYVDGRSAPVWQRDVLVPGRLSPIVVSL